MLIKRSTGLVLYCKYDPGAGTFKDFSRNKHTITNHNVVPVRGKFGGAGYYNGTNAYLDCGNDSSLDITDAITVEAWVKASSFNGLFQRIVIHGIASSSGYQLTVKNGKITLSRCNTTDWQDSTQRETTTAIETGKWYHIVGTYDNGIFNIYFNGVAQSLSAEDQLGYGTGSDLLIGKRSDGYAFNGTIDEVRIYNRALSTSEILAHYKAKGYYGPLVHAPIRIP